MADQVRLGVAAALPVPGEDGRHPVPELLDVAVQGGAGLGVQPVLGAEHGQLPVDDVLELPHPGRHQVADDAQRLLAPAGEEVLHDEDGVVDLALELDLLLVGEAVVDEHGVVGSGGLHGLDGARVQHLGREGPAVAQSGQRHGEVGAEGPAAHLDVVDGLGDPVVLLVGQLPQPALQHDLDGGAQDAAAALGHGFHRAGPQVGEAPLEGVERRLGDDAVQRHEPQEPVVAGLRRRHVVRPAEDAGVDVVAVRPPGEPARREVELLPGRLGMDAGGAQPQCVVVELLLAPEPREHVAGGRREQSHPVAPREAVAAGGGLVGAQSGLEGHVEVGERQMTDRLERYVRVGAQPGRQGRHDRGHQERGRGAEALGPAE